MAEQENREVVKRMWLALSAMDWDAMKSCMHPEIHYRDVPSDDPGAHGPDNCVKRLQIAFKHLSKQDQVTHHLVTEGNTVFLDHTETWTFKSGETASHTFASMHEMKDGLVYRWSDYWDMQKFVGQFPEWFLEEMMKASADDFS
ncbi:MAG: nuclear transport factor 2 family protein [Halioglobus sp.]